MFPLNVKIDNRTGGLGQHCWNWRHTWCMG